MCGLAGVYGDAGSVGARQSEALSRMSADLAVRGPDDAGEYRSERCLFAHRRLSIQDLSSAGHQPMRHASGATIVFNGEIYNTGPLRTKLEAAGETFRGHSDTEVVLAAYVAWGLERTLEELNGMFALAIHDPVAETLLLARDRVGIKPLYYGFDREGRLWFASELKPLMEHAGLDVTLDRGALADYAALGFVPGPRTIYASARSLQPGHWARVDRGAVRERAWWRAPDAPCEMDYDTAREELGRLLGEAVEKRLVSDVPLGAFLSGGIDSSAICAVMQPLTGGQLQTFSIGYPDEPVLDETRWAQLVAAHLGTHHHPHGVATGDLLTAIDACQSRAGQPFADPSLLPSYLVARYAREEVTLVLSGDGADELLAGYNKYLMEPLRERYLRIPGPLRRLGESALEHLPAHRGSRLGELVRKARKFTSGAASPPAERWLRMQSVGPEGGIRSLLPGVAPGPPPVLERVDAILRRHASVLEGVLQADLAITLPDKMLHKVDLASMSNSLEVRVPFLDHEFVEFAVALPLEHKIRGRERKRVLKEFALPLLPPELKNRPKQGFDVPVGRLLAGPLRERFLDSVRGPRASSLLEPAAVEALLQRHQEGRVAADQALWAVFALALWCESMPIES